MKRTKTFLIIALVMIGFLMAGCELSFSPTSLTDDEVNDVRLGLNQPDELGSYTDGNISISTGAGFDAAATEVQYVDIFFQDAHVDADTIDAITFRTLRATADADGAYSREAVLSPNSSEVIINSTSSIIRYTFNVEDATDISNPIEVSIDGSTLTFAEGTRQMDLDNDDVMGEAVDDDYVGYITVANPDVAAAGNQRAPRDTIGYIGGLGAAAIGDTELVYTWNTDQLTSATLNASYQLYSYNSTTDAWDPVNTTGAFDDTTQEYTVTLPAAIETDELYRVEWANPYDIQENATTNGYARRVTTEQRLNVLIAENSQEFIDADTEFYNGGSAALFDSISVNSDSEGYNVSIEINFDETVIGNEGVSADTISTDSFRLYDSNDNKYVEWASSIVVTSQTNQDVFKDDYLILSLSPSYEFQGNALQLHIGPSVLVMGDTDAADDDLYIGDLTNTETSYPYGQFRVYNTGTNF